MNNLSDDELGRKYLLYLRDMSRKLIYSSSSSTAGNYSSILILNRRTNDELIYSRITDWNLDILRRKEKGGYNRICKRVGHDKAGFRNLAQLCVY